MGSFGRTPGRLSNSVLVLVFMQCVIVSQFSKIIYAAKHSINEMAELQESMARYRPLIAHENTGTLSNQLQVEDENFALQGDGELNPKEPEKHEDEFQVEQKTVVHVDAKGVELERPTEGNSNENPNPDHGTTKQQREGMLEKVVEAKSKTDDVELMSKFEEQEQQRGHLEKVVQPERKSEGQQQKEALENFKIEELEDLENSKIEEQEGSEYFNIVDQTDLQNFRIVQPELKTAEQQQQQVGSDKVAQQDPKTEGQQQHGDVEKVPELKSTAEEHQKQGQEQKVEEKTEEEEEPFVFPEPYLLGPTIKDWDEQRGGWLDSNPRMRSQPNGEPRVLIVTGSKPAPCESPIGDNFHIKSLKLKIDYARMHNYEIFYNFAHFDPLFDTYWVKLPTVRKLMLTHPEIEWFFWVDSDAMFTDMLFEAPFHTYEGYKMVMWGWEEGLLKEKSWVAYNAGVFLMRNCQWSLDLIDKWSPFGPKGPVRDQHGKMLTSFLTWRGDNFPADDQSALAYLIITDEAVRAKVKLVDSSDYMMSGFWLDVVDTYEDCTEKYHPGLGDKRWPWITHFTGCGPCAGGGNPDPAYERCMETFGRAYNFADNQVLVYMGFQHESLSSPAVIRTRNETDKPLEFLSVDPWAERIAEVAGRAAAACGFPAMGTYGISFSEEERMSTFGNMSAVVLYSNTFPKGRKV